MKKQTTRKKLLHRVRDFQVLIIEENQERFLNISDIIENSLDDIRKNKKVVNIKYFIEK